MAKTTTKKSASQLRYAIYEVLKEHSDELHPMTQKEIYEKLTYEHNTICNIRSLRAHILALYDEGKVDYVQDSDVTANRKKKNPKAITNIYACADNDAMTDSEIIMCISGILTAKSIPYNYKKEIIGKLRKGSKSVTAGNMAAHAYSSSNTKATHLNKELSSNLDILDEAIEARKKVAFRYCDYNTDGSLSENPYTTTVSPYYILASQDQLYLLAGSQKSRVIIYRLDKIKGICIVDEKSTPMEKVPGLGRYFNFSDFLRQHPAMYYSSPKTITFTIKKDFIKLAFDYFETDLKYISETAITVTYSTRIGTESYKFWAMKYADVVLTLSPQDVVTDIKDQLAKALMQYENRSLDEEE